MSLKIKILVHFAFILLLALVSANGQTYFCSSQCADYITACYNMGESDCYACAQNIYQLEKNSSGVCQLKSQTQILFSELKTTALSLVGYSSSKPTPYQCGSYYVSGQYVAGDFLQKTFTNIPLNHYQLVVRFGISFIGNWSESDQIQLTADGHTYSWTYNGCAVNESLCGAYGLDCIKIRERIISHNSSNITLRFSSSIVETDPNQKNWGIKDLIIAARLCSSRCLTCFGPKDSDCMTCAPDYYLLGNLCVPKCEFFALIDKRICVEQCPLAYFQSSNNICSPCQADCLVCNNANSCDVWSSNKPGAVWEKNKTFFILLIFIAIAVTAYFLWKLVIKKYLKKKDFDTVSDMKKRIITQGCLDENINGNANDSKVKSSSSENNNDDEIQNVDGKLQSNNFNSKVNNFSGVTQPMGLEESGLQWNQEIPSVPTIDQIIVSNPNNPQKKKKKRFRPTGLDNSSLYPSSLDIDGTIENLNL